MLSIGNTRRIRRINFWNIKHAQFVDQALAARISFALIAFGTEEQKRRFLPGLGTGELIGAQAMSESHSGSDAYALHTAAARKGDRFILNGSKIFVTNGPIADVIIVFATVDRSRGVFGGEILSRFLLRA